MLSKEVLPKKLINRQHLAEMGIAYSNSHLLKLEKDGLFPSRIYISAQKICWSLEEIEAWIVKRQKARGGVHG